ncbi:MAG: efflux RND transporter permease subunit [Fimbriiglobus sp.]|nr:efflux RND transporter permease subunit [Fimbriiglobus sp.]
MLNGVIRLALRYRGLVLLLALVVMVYGSYLATTMPIDVFPDLDRPRVVLLTECPGLSPEEVESLVAQPIETAILGAPGVQAVRSQSSQGLAVTYVEFGWQTEVRYARQIVQERLTAVGGTLPPGIRPLMTPPSSIMGQIMHVGLSRQKGPGGGVLAAVGRTGMMAERVETDGKPALAVWRPKDRHDPKTWERVPVENPAWDAGGSGRTATFAYKGRQHAVTFRTAEEQRMDLRTVADWVIRPRLLKEQGVAEVIVLGGDRKQYQVLVNPDKLLEYGVTIQDVDRAIGENNLNASGGFTEEGQVERPVRVIARLGPQPAKVLDDLRKVAVKTDGDRPILLGQVATVTEGPAPKRGDAGIDGADAVVITVVKQPHADTRALTTRVKAAVREVEAALPADYVANTELFQLKDFIDRGVYYVGEALVIGAVLVVIILFLFLLNFRTTFITLTAIPLSLVVTTLVFRVVGALTGTELSINVMTLGGIAVAMGELVDDAIVDVENIFRRLRENSVLPAPRPAIVVIYEASREVRSAIVFGTAVVVLAFLPLFALSGVEGRLFVPLGLAYIVSILASLVVSLTVTPVLSYYLLPQSKAAHGDRDGFLLRALKWLAGFLIRFSMRHAGLLLLLTWVVVGYCGWRLSTLGSDFLPKFDEGSIQINVTLPAGSSLKASGEAAVLIDAKLKNMQQSPANPDGPIRHFVRRTGRAELDEHAEPVGRSEYILAMNPESGRSREEMLETLLKELREEVPGVDFEAEQPMAHLISHMLSGVTAQIAIKVYGDDLDQLQRLATQIKAAISDVPGVTPPVIDPQETVDELHVVLRPDDLARYGLSREYVARFIETAMKGEVVSQVLEGQRRFDLVVKLNAAYRTDYHRLGELRIDLPGPARVPASLADGPGTGAVPRQVRLKDVADLPDAAGGPNQINRENVRRRAVIRCNTQGRDLAGVVADIEQRVKTRVPMPEGYFVEYGGQFEAQRSATVLISVLALVSVAGVFVVLYLLYPSVRVSLQILNAVPTAFIGGVIALVLTNQTLTVASLVGFVSLGGIAVRNGILLVTHYFHLMKEDGLPFSQQTVLRGSLERLAPVLMTALTAGIGLIPLVVGGKKPGLEILYPVSTVILGGLVTSTFCEFLIHPGLFWKFSGKDAERLARTDAASDELAGARE